MKVAIEGLITFVKVTGMFQMLVGMSPRTVMVMVAAHAFRRVEEVTKRDNRIASGNHESN